MLKKYLQSFATSELGRLHALFPFSELARQMHLKSSALGRKSCLLYTSILRQIFDDTTLELDFNYKDYSFLIQTRGKSVSYTHLDVYKRQQWT